MSETQVAKVVLSLRPTLSLVYERGLELWMILYFETKTERN